jgi:hypothetical protein
MQMVGGLKGGGGDFPMVGGWDEQEGQSTLAWKKAV